MYEVDNDLWVSDLSTVQTHSTQRFDRVISVCQDSAEDNVSCAYNHYQLSDGPPDPTSKNPGEFSYNLFEEAVDTAIAAILSGETVLIHCHAGQSRSPAVASTVYSAINDVHISDAVAHVTYQLNVPMPNKYMDTLMYTYHERHLSHKD